VVVRVYTGHGSEAVLSDNSLSFLDHFAILDVHFLISAWIWSVCVLVDGILLYIKYILYVVNQRVNNRTTAYDVD
jgi:hypothetical protein